MSNTLHKWRIRDAPEGRDNMHLFNNNPSRHCMPTAKFGTPPEWMQRENALTMDDYALYDAFPLCRLPQHVLIRYIGRKILTHKHSHGVDLGCGWRLFFRPDRHSRTTKPTNRSCASKIPGGGNQSALANEIQGKVLHDICIDIETYLARVVAQTHMI